MRSCARILATKVLAQCGLLCALPPAQTHPHKHTRPPAILYTDTCTSNLQFCSPGDACDDAACKQKCTTGTCMIPANGLGQCISGACCTCSPFSRGEFPCSAEKKRGRMQRETASLSSPERYTPSCATLKMFLRQSMILIVPKRAIEKAEKGGGGRGGCTVLL